MTGKSKRKNRITLAFTGITTGFLTIAFALTPSAQATPDKPRHNHTADCNIVAKTDRPLCLKVQRQRAYGWTYGPNGEGLATNPSGVIDVHDATHQGLTRAEMHNYLLGYRDQYREHVTRVSVDVDTLEPGCVFTVGTVRRDGVKVTQTRVFCPK